MKILVYDMGSYTYHDLIFYLKKLGHSCHTIYYHFPDKFHDEFFTHHFSGHLRENHYDCVFSINFFPLIAQLCDQFHIKYLSWCYDSPMEENLEKYFHYETNHIFIFDEIEALQYNRRGHQNVYHMPLAVNTARLDRLTFSKSQISAYQTDISFVGRLYQHSPLNALLYSADDYTKGYIEGIFQTQLRIYGSYLLDDLIPDDLLEHLNAGFRTLDRNAVPLTRRGLSYAIASQITYRERTFLLEQLGESFHTKLYSTDAYPFPPGSLVENCGPAKYYSEMPGIFRYSKLNLCPTLKCIQSGIPLRALDIMGSKGVLFSNYQPELAELFQDGEDCIMYESMEDACDKASFYLAHDDLRRQIARNGYNKVAEGFRYEQRLTQIFSRVYGVAP